METITEDYVSFETAKLLKEKGFNSPCMGRYSVRSMEFHLDCTKMCNNGGLFEYAAPSQAVAMKWLREVHNIHIDIDPDWASKGGFAVIGYCFNIHSIVNPWYEDLVTYPTYEQAVEAAIKYCLDLI